jgi:hypothetical protein
VVASGSGNSTTLPGIPAGIYTFSTKNEAGCVSSSSATVNIISHPSNPPTPVISLIGDTLYSDALSGNQWYNQNGMISGATNQEYIATSNGDYFVIVTVAGCSSDTSNIIHLTSYGFSQHDPDPSIKIYPNPFSDELIIATDLYTGPFIAELSNLLGQTVYKCRFSEKLVINTSTFPGGIYMIRIIYNESIMSAPLIKY